tara:strand:- start:1520 stop:2044 length:525 start_codon:yes stop_codon:yes gene_type:complete
MPSRATKFTTMPNGNELTIPKIESLVLNQPDRNMGNINNITGSLPVVSNGKSFNPFYDLSQWLTGGIDTLSTDLQNQVSGVLPTFNAGIEQANTWIDENYPKVMQMITDHTELAKTDFEAWAKNEERKQKETWEEYAKAFGSGSGNLSTFLSGAGIGSLVLLGLLAVVFLKGKN